MFLSTIVSMEIFFRTTVHLWLAICFARSVWVSNSTIPAASAKEEVEDYFAFDVLNLGIRNFRSIRVFVTRFSASSRFSPHFFSITAAPTPVYFFRVKMWIILSPSPVNPKPLLRIFVNRSFNSIHHDLCISP